MPTEYESRLIDRAERFRSRAEKIRARSVALVRSAEQATAGIPSGQPILVDHYSAPRHRRDLARHDKRMRAAIEAERYAAELERRAEGVGRAGISSDDPDAAEKLTAKAATIDNRVEEMKRVNAAWRKAGKPDPANAEGWQQVADLLGVPAESLFTLRRNFATYRYQGQPYPAYAITNARANQRRTEARAANLAGVDRDAADRRYQVAGVTIEESAGDNRLRLYFDGKPSDEVRHALKASGFRWAPSVGAWQRHLSTAALYNAGRVLGADTSGMLRARDTAATTGKEG